MFFTVGISSSAHNLPWLAQLDAITCICSTMAGKFPALSRWCCSVKAVPYVANSAPIRLLNEALHTRNACPQVPATPVGQPDAVKVAKNFHELVARPLPRVEG